MYRHTCPDQRTLAELIAKLGARKGPRRRGAVLVLSAILLVMMVGMLSFAIDYGYMLHVRTEMQRAVDAGAMAGAGVMVNGTNLADQEVRKYVKLNTTGKRTVADANMQVEFGQWDPVARLFTPGGALAPSAIRVSASNPGLPLFFGRILGTTSFNSSAQAVVTYLPRDIMLALDYSGSMCFDSQLCSIDRLGRAAIEANLQTIYNQLGKPKLGSMKFKPVKITSTNLTTILKQLKLTNVAYPYSGGSWADYVDYVQTDSDIAAAGYKNYYGYLTWVNYLQAQQQSASQTPNLWKTSEQPVTAVKDAVDVFVDFLQDNSTNDRLGFSLYTSSNDTAKLESGLTKNMQTVATLVRQRQAGHYVGGTNIYDGMKTARLELENNGRVGAKKMIVLMTDGVATLPYVNGVSPQALCLQEAQLAAQKKIAIVTICLGSLADNSLLAQIAQITGGDSFVVGGGTSIAQVQAQLLDVFERVANTRPFKIVK